MKANFDESFRSNDNNDPTRHRSRNARVLALPSLIIRRHVLKHLVPRFHPGMVIALVT